ncbi:MAG: hypothetical protein FWD09_01820, partial [Lentimicrobiaceae bacterium]|nr:hypothetical protein [Lentimicrobiaceae bacterium]
MMISFLQIECQTVLAAKLSQGKIIIFFIFWACPSLSAHLSYPRSGRGGYGVRFAPVLACGSHRLRRPPPRSRRGNTTVCA